ncbi:MAG: A/G-specific adenine glycosylase [Flavobacterium sp.]|jgi:A/G-specific adenine glycosylase|nr:A/G-specific adenine glycosylase [Flavobacterium sp.]HQV35611.1 A/G-specific adenine glycosylase [Flavobacterium sp.]HQX03983.1 A/G-specific adenine glycosylase [Flavobacterium sp.]HRZ32237.1 A/G-specific adenine glycosylase [Flavobacterium sp.]
MTFSNRLISWYLENKRDLPWRNTTNPYKIWLSEIILQQTRVAQGLPYYIAFVETFPTVFDLANASEEQVLKLWQGLGYYSRARNLHKTAQLVAFDLGGNFPTSYQELLKLKGIGTYTAAAIASFSSNEPVPVVDGNVFRVLARYFDVETDISSTIAKKEFTALAYEVLDKTNSLQFNQAIMEFGALQCMPKNPNCSVCVLNDSCVALQKNKINQLPVKLKKTKVTERFFNYLVFEDELGNSIIQQRTEKGIWHNLYEFPLIESFIEFTEKEITDEINKMKFFSNEIMSINAYEEKSVLHILSHQRLKIRFWNIQLKGKLENAKSKQSIKKRPFPIVIFNFIEKYF